MSESNLKQEMTVIFSADELSQILARLAIERLGKPEYAHIDSYWNIDTDANKNFIGIKITLKHPGGQS